MIPAYFTVGQFVHMIHKKVNVGAEKTIFIFVNSVLPPTVKLNLINFNLMFNVFATNIVWHFLFQYLSPPPPPPSSSSSSCATWGQ